MAMNILTPNQLKQRAPAVYASAPDHQVSERYGFVPTIEVVEALQNEGWYPVRALQTNVRDPQRQSIARHMIRFRQDPDRQISVGDAVAELVLTNSHDRTSAYQLDLRLFRLVCSNGMVTPTSDLGGIRVRHGKHVVENILEGSINLQSQTPRIAESVEAFRSTLVSADESRLFARAALALRYGEDWQTQSPVEPKALLQARRSEDKVPCLWKLFNRVQENMLKGGLSGRSVSGRATKTRAMPQ